ncbi:hypothetical protein DSO57_1034862 [Entomophthora muscae]|uniref:Uncharacterized protein n=1 Tax=Entomophthora muscae TaxID=34485 RepID=A0ACC2TAZ8_9FUNG|nr:hypothetical protein DSO57_1034862 [Entomophthora muscae]
MGSENIEAPTREDSLEVTQTPLNPKQSLIFEAMTDSYNPRKRPKTKPDDNEVVADILRKFISRGEYPFPEEEIRRALGFNKKSLQVTTANIPQKNIPEVNSKTRGSQGKRTRSLTVLLI